MIEITTGAIFVLTTFIVIGTPVDLFLRQFAQLFFLIYLLLIVSTLIIVFFMDLKYGIIPFKVVIASIAVITLRYFFLSFGDTGYIFNYLLPAAGVFMVFFLLFLITRGRGMGFGDVVFSFLMGYILGYPKIILAVYIAFLTGAFVSLILVFARKKKFKGGIIPFGPFLVSGTVISLFWGQFIIDRIISYFHV